ncbi:MAG: hypothetical protein ABI855_12115 [Bacteroidota bacterium]
MMDVKSAAEVSADYLKKFFPGAAKIQLEEVEITDDKKYWNITLSYEGAEVQTGFITFGARSFRTFKVDSESGEVLAMKMKSVK